MKKLFIFILIFQFQAFPVYATQVGDSAPQFNLPNINDNQNTSLKQKKGKVIYLDFWASWCAPCRTSFPLLNDLYSKYKDQDFEVIAINLDENVDAAKEFLSDFPVAFTTLRDAKGEFAELYEVESMPSSFIIDRDGVVQLVHKGFSKSDMDEIEQKVSLLVKSK